MAARVYGRGKRLRARFARPRPWEGIRILGYHRIDTLYDPGDQRIKNAAECAPPNQCTEVRLEVSNFQASTTSASSKTSMARRRPRATAMPKPPVVFSVVSIIGPPE